MMNLDSKVLDNGLKTWGQISNVRFAEHASKNRTKRPSNCGSWRVSLINILLNENAELNLLPSTPWNGHFQVMRERANESTKAHPSKVEGRVARD